MGIKCPLNGNFQIVYVFWFCMKMNTQNIKSQVAYSELRDRIRGKSANSRYTTLLRTNILSFNDFCLAGENIMSHFLLCFKNM